MQDKYCDELRACAAGVLAALARAGSSLLWSNGGYGFEEAVKACVAGLEDPMQVWWGGAVRLPGWSRGG